MTNITLSYTLISRIQHPSRLFIAFSSSLRIIFFIPLRCTSFTISQFKPLFFSSSSSLFFPFCLYSAWAYTPGVRLSYTVLSTNLTAILYKSCLHQHSAFLHTSTKFFLPAPSIVHLNRISYTKARSSKHYLGHSLSTFLLPFACLCYTLPRAC